GAVFATTLRRSATPLITRLAARVHSTMTPTMVLYTRHLTVLWTLYFAVMVVLSVSLYEWAPWWVWSLFANVATPLAAIGLFIGEHWLRFRLHPEFERSSMLQAWRAWRSTPLAPARRP
ncbi:MAG TPA: acyl carrier protein, partial [Burkholderiaceae bacterium]|nr:acyl carrier protein [Burkholderiaceae bacterium]